MTDIPKTQMDADLARWTVRRLLERMENWANYAAEPATDQQQAEDKLATLAQVMRNNIEDIAGRWDEGTDGGLQHSYFESDGGSPFLTVGPIEDEIREARRKLGGESLLS